MLWVRLLSSSSIETGSPEEMIAREASQPQVKKSLYRLCQVKEGQELLSNLVPPEPLYLKGLQVLSTKDSSSI